MGGNFVELEMESILVIYIRGKFISFAIFPIGFNILRWVLQECEVNSLEIPIRNRTATVDSHQLLGLNEENPCCCFTIDFLQA